MNHTAQPENTRDPRRMVTFTVGAEEFGVPIRSVREIVRMMKITAVPDTPADIRGIVNLRGSVIPIVDLRRRFHVEHTQDPEDRRIVVLDMADQAVGFLVDRVGRVLSVDNERVNPPPERATTASAPFIDGIVNLEDRLIILLDPGRLIAGETCEKTGRPVSRAA